LAKLETPTCLAFFAYCKLSIVFIWNLVFVFCLPG